MHLCTLTPECARHLSLVPLRLMHCAAALWGSGLVGCVVLCSVLCSMAVGSGRCSVIW
jgi:hypothetical protein